MCLAGSVLRRHEDLDLQLRPSAHIYEPKGRTRSFNAPEYAPESTDAVWSRKTRLRDRLRPGDRESRRRLVAARGRARGRHLIRSGGQPATPRDIATVAVGLNRERSCLDDRTTGGVHDPE